MVRGSSIFQDAGLESILSRFVGSPMADVTHNNPSQVEPLGVGCTVRSIALAMNFVSIYYVSTKQQEDFS